ncbi:MAG TPA: hypothetical protein VG106_09350, partial [Vicinamibacterales bacterium]|nr:hypothetical protein [Vicinamibacterales bacterium]
MTSEPAPPRADWLWSLLDIAPVAEGEDVEIRGQRYVMRDGLLRDSRVLSESQAQTSRVFGFKWQQRDTFESPVMQRRARDWLVLRYGAIDGKVL